MCKYYSYMRISTKEEKGKQGFARQENAINSWCKKNNIEISERRTFKDDCSGKSFDRPSWKELEDTIVPGDTIVFKDLCRFTREFDNGFAKYMELMNNNINLIFLDNYIVSTDYIKDLIGVAEKQENRIAKKSLKDTIELLIMVELDRAENERTTLSKRTSDGMKAKKKAAEEQGLEWHCGRPKGKLDKITDELKEDIRLFITDRSIKQVDLIAKHNISRNTLKKYIKLYQDGLLD